MTLVPMTWRGATGGTRRERRLRRLSFLLCRELKKKKALRLHICRCQTGSCWLASTKPWLKSARGHVAYCWCARVYTLKKKKNQAWWLAVLPSRVSSVSVAPLLLPGVSADISVRAGLMHFSQVAHVCMCRRPMTTCHRVNGEQAAPLTWPHFLGLHIDCTS